MESASNEPSPKRQRRHYHRQHRLAVPVEPGLPENVLADDATLTDLLNRSIGWVLKEQGYDGAVPVALDALRNAAEEYMLHFASLVCQTMGACRRTQPIPQDFEHALRRSFITTDSLRPHLKPIGSPIPMSIPLETPRDDELNDYSDPLIIHPSLSGAEERARAKHIPSHFPQFPSLHSYRHTPVYPERELDVRKIRERATEDGRHGEEALRKLVRARLKDPNARGVGHSEKRLWGRRFESMETMFETTVRELSKKAQRDDSGKNGLFHVDGSGATERTKSPALSAELAPIINCESHLLRKTPSTTAQKAGRRVDSKDFSMDTVEH